MSDAGQETWNEGELFRLLVANVKDFAIYVTDPQGCVQSWNPSAERLLGYSAEEILGQSSEIFFTPEDIASGVPQRELQEALEQGRGNDDRWHVRKDGSRFWSGGMMTPLWSEDRTLRGFAKILRDRSEWKQAEQERLSQAKAVERRWRLYEAALSNTPDLVYVFGLDHRFVYANEGLLEMWGRTWEDAIGKNCLELDYEPWHAAMHDREIEQVIATRQPLKGEVPFTGTFGRRIYEYIFVPVIGENGEVEAVAGTTRDVTDHKKTEERLRHSEERFRSLVEQAPFSVQVFSPDGRTIRVNRAWEELWGVRLEQIEGYNVLEDRQLEARGVLHYIHQAFAGQPARVPAIEYNPNDTIPDITQHADPRRWLSAVIYPVRDADGQIQDVVLIHEDITERTRLEEELRLRVEQLAEADRRKDEFLATLAHELRNPLAPIRNSLQILKLPRVDAETAQQTREVMERQVHHLVRLVDDLLDVSRVMRGKIELRQEKIELATVVARAVETAQPLIEVQGHRLDISLPSESLLLNADPVRLAQVVGNLLTNAAKYTESNGQIWLSAEREDDRVVLRVRDSGIGIAADMLPQVFDLFVQVDHAATRSQGGLGIGLTLVKNLVEMHDGSVEASSAGLGSGSEFLVRLPLWKERPEPAAAETREPRHAAPSSGNRLLIVDDNRDAAMSLAMLLRLQGHEVRVAHDGPSSLTLATTYRPDLVFLDIGMPGMDGFEVARQLRQTPGLERTILAALTGWGQQEDRRRTAEAGFDHHLVKPPEPKIVENLLAELKRRKV